MSLSEFFWEIPHPSPSKEATSIHFDLADLRLYRAVAVTLSPSVAANLASFLKSFCFLQQVCGSRVTAGRISEMYQEGDPALPYSPQWQATMAVLITVQGVKSLHDPLLHRHAQFKKNASPPDLFSIELSSLHGWALHECADYLLRDYLPQLSSIGLPSLNQPTVQAQYAQAVRAHFRPIAELFTDENNPYYRLAEIVDSSSPRLAESTLAASGVH